MWGLKDNGWVSEFMVNDGTIPRESKKNGGERGLWGAGIKSTIWSIDLARVHMRKAETTNFSPKEEFVAGKWLQRSWLHYNFCVIMRYFCFLWALSSIHVFFFFLIKR